MINFGLYLDTIGEGDVINNAFEAIEFSLKENIIKDASLFYDQIGSIKSKPPCGIFHSSDLWNFSGHIFVLSVTSIQRVKNIANNIKIYLGYGWQERNVLATLQAISDDTVEVLPFSVETAADFYRISNRKSIGVSNNFKEIIQIITEKENERSRNN